MALPSTNMSAELSLHPAEGALACAELADLAGRIWREHYTPIIGAEQVEYMLERFQSAPAIARRIEAGEEYYLARLGQRSVGYLGLAQQAEALFLSKCYLLAEVRGRGFGMRLLQFAETRARALGFRSLSLTVNRHNRLAIAAYERHGYRCAGEVCSDIGGGFVMDDYRFVRSVTESPGRAEA